LENQIIILNLNIGLLPTLYFDKIKSWIGGNKEKIGFSLIFKLKEEEKDFNRFHQNVNTDGPLIFIFITENMSVFGSYCPRYNTTENAWINDSDAFLFSLNLDKKYPKKKEISNYFRGICGYHFQDIEYCSFSTKKGTLKKNWYLS